MVITHPSVRWRPATAATRSSLIPFWKSTITPSGSFRNRRMNIVAHCVVPFDGEKDRVERLLNALRFVEVQCVDRHDVVRPGAAELQTVGLDLLDVGRPLVDQRDVVSR